VFDAHIGTVVIETAGRKTNEQGIIAPSFASKKFNVAVLTVRLFSLAWDFMVNIKGQSEKFESYL
jgi:hypothetical protein